MCVCALIENSSKHQLDTNYNRMKLTSFEVDSCPFNESFRLFDVNATLLQCSAVQYTF